MTSSQALSERDRAAVDQLRALVKEELTPYYDTDFNLLRWLRGHNYNLEEILPKLRNHLTFRRSHWDLDTAHRKPRDHPVHAHWQAGLTGLAVRTEDTFVNIEQSGANDYWGLLQTYPLNEVMRARVYDLEVMLHEVMEHERKTGRQASVMYVMDLSGLHFDKHLMTLLTGALASISAFMAEHYVELVHSFVLVNVPTFISAIWTVVKPLLPERTKHKVNILGSHWKTEILELAVPEALPTFWNAEGEQVFRADVLQAVPFPEAGFYRGGPPADAQTLTVPAGKAGSVSAAARKGQRLRWCFSADGHFAYGLFLTAEGAQVRPAEDRAVYPRFNKVPGPTVVPLSDFIECPADGTYHLWFSNEHAWLHSLRVSYRLEAGDHDQDAE